MAVKQRSTKTVKERDKANKIFTDRVEPRKAFWDTYSNYKAVMDSQEENDICLLTYYGIGGIGKTTLLHKLEDEIEDYKAVQRIKENVPYVYYDFDWGTGKVKVLEKLRDELSKRYKFKFPEFNTALEIYKEKSETGKHRQEKKGYFSDREVLGAAGDFLADGADLLNLVPGVGPAALSTLKLADTLLAKVSDYWNDKKEVLQQLLNAKPQDLFEELQFRFAEDLTENMAKQKYPLVIFLDTYEQLVNELKNSGQPLNNDKWLRNLENGLVVYAPKTIWVIAGREILKWAQIDSDWEDNLKDQQHIMGALSEADTMEFLEDSKIEEADVRDFIYEITNGTPVYLDLCVNNYFAIKETGMAVTKARIGKNKIELVARFLRYTDDVKEALLYVLACIGSWRAEDIEEIVSPILPAITGIVIRSVSNYSFVEETGNGYYKLHKTIKDILVERCDPILRKQVNTVEQRYYEEKLSQLDVFNDLFGFYLERYIENTLELVVLPEEFIEALDDKLLPLIARYNDNYQYGEALNAFLPILNCFDRYEDDKVKVRILFEASKYFHYAKQRSNAWETIERAMTLAAEVLEENDPLYLKCRHSMAISILEKGEKEKAQVILEDILKRQRQVIGADHKDAQLTAMNLSNIYGNEGRIKDSILLSKEVYESRRAIYGNQHSYTLKAKRIYGLNLKKADFHEEATQVLKETFDEMLEFLGPNNPNTCHCFHNVTPLLKRQRQYESLVEMTKALLPSLETRLGSNSEAFLVIKNDYAQALVAAKDYELALDVYLSLYQQYETLVGPQDSKTINCGFALAKVYEALNKIEDAITLYEVVHERLFDKKGMETEGTLKIMARLTVLYDGVGDVKSTLYWAKRYLEALDDVLEDDRKFDWDVYDYVIRALQISNDLEGVIAYRRQGIGHKYKVFKRILEAYSEKTANSYLDAKMDRRIENLCQLGSKYASEYLDLADLWSRQLCDRKKYKKAYHWANKVLRSYQEETRTPKEQVEDQKGFVDELRQRMKEKAEDSPKKSYIKTFFKRDSAFDQAVKQGDEDQVFSMCLAAKVELAFDFPYEKLDVRAFFEDKRFKTHFRRVISGSDSETYDQRVSQYKAFIERLRIAEHPDYEEEKKFLEHLAWDYEKQMVEDRIEKSPKQHDDLGWTSYGKKDYKAAVTYFRAAIETIETKWDGKADMLESPCRGLGLTYFELGDHEAAKSFLIRAQDCQSQILGVSARGDEVRYHLAEVYLKRIYREALGDEKVQAIEDEFQTLVQAADQLKLDGQYEEARETLMRAQALVDPIFEWDSEAHYCIHFGLAQIFEAIGEYEGALSAMKGLMENRPDAMDLTMWSKYRKYYREIWVLSVEAALDPVLVEEIKTLHAESRSLVAFRDYKTRKEVNAKLYKLAVPALPKGHPIRDYIEIFYR
ncbi:MAG: hypothetical protein JXO44_04480 [Clostridia bacterium]|nr:hypothetical protein [Clostridia bacterium]